ncbi:hypothetical protein MLDJOKPK_00024 [Salmonella phage SPAsTU]|nr:hypothetical protein MLDJOKPK_00024 [Salmonella phage SPAsTU]
MIDWLLGLINKRQKELHKENTQLKKEVKALRASNEHLAPASIIALEVVKRQQELNRRGHIYTAPELQLTEELIAKIEQDQNIGLYHLTEIKK